MALALLTVLTEQIRTIYNKTCMLTPEKASLTHIGASDDEAAWPAFSAAPPSYGCADWHETPVSNPPEWRSSWETEKWCLSPVVWASWALIGLIWYTNHFRITVCELRKAHSCLGKHRVRIWKSTRLFAQKPMQIKKSPQLFVHQSYVLFGRHSHVI
jgi:hypothetical protein